jgi:hypothetical protein
MKSTERTAEYCDKVSDKIIKMLDNIEDASAMAIINYCFVKLLIMRVDNPVSMKAAIVTFMVNCSNSIDAACEEEVEDQVH